MRIHSDIITTNHVVDALNNAKAKGRVAPEVGIDTLTKHGSRKRNGAVEIQLGASISASFLSGVVKETLESDGAHPKAIKKAGRRWPRQGKSQFAGDHLASGATWFEWGHVIAELFLIDEDAIIGDYDGEDGFYYQTYDRKANYGHAWEFIMGETGNGRCYNFLADVG